MFKNMSIQDAKHIAVGVVAALGGIATIVWSFVYITPRGKEVAGWAALDRWQAMGMLVVALGIAFGVVAMLRFALAPLITEKSSTAVADANVALRSRIAPIVLSIGSIAIVVLAVALIIAFVFLATGTQTIEANKNVADKIDTLLTGVFTTVLPVVATWVGTVLAFYFGSENFRQAADSTRQVLSDRQVAKKKITDLMVPYDRIGRQLVDNDDDAPKIKMSDVIHTMSEAAPRVIVFDKRKQTPIYIIRSNTPPMPKGWITPEYGTTKITDETKDDNRTPKEPGDIKHISDYLKEDKNKEDAENFRFVDVNTTPEDALALMAKEGVDDVFVTQDGQKTSSVLGWVTSSSLRRT